MRVLVLGGAGAVCQETTKDLSEFSTFEEIVVADQNLPAVQQLIETLGDGRLQPLHVDARDTEGLIQLFPAFDIVVNGLPFQFDYAVNKVCVETGVSGLDLSSEDPQFDLDPVAPEGMLFVPGMGATPGITNMMARRASEVLDHMEVAEVFFAAFRCLAPAPGLLQTTLWEFNPEEEDRAEVYFEGGSWHATPPLSGEIEIRFHEHIGVQKVYYVPHDEASTFPRSFPSLRRAAVRGCFPPHVMELMGALMQAGLLSSRTVNCNGQPRPTIEVIRDLLADNPFSQENPIWAYGLVVEVSGKRAGRATRCIYRSHHPSPDEWGGRAAYFKNVGIPLSIGAQMIAAGETTAQGVKPPELAFPTGPFFKHLARRGITIEETIIEAGEVTS